MSLPYADSCLEAPEEEEEEGEREEQVGGDTQFPHKRAAAQATRDEEEEGGAGKAFGLSCHKWMGGLEEEEEESLRTNTEGERAMPTIKLAFYRLWEITG